MMASKSGIYTIAMHERQGVDNLGHTISEVGAVIDEKQNTVTSTETLTSNMIPKSTERSLKAKTFLALDLIVFVALVIWVILAEVIISPSIKQGFYCGDEKISYKYDGDTISTAMLMVSILVPFFLVWFFEAITYKSESLKNTRLKQSFFMGWNIFREFMIGFLMHMLIIECMKVIVGELRPHFLDSCRPDAAINCTKGTYISKYTCTNKQYSSFNIKDSSKSFPSGHSSISTFEAVFMIWYLQHRGPKTSSRLLVPFLQSLCLLWACVCCITRVTDNRHHWWDVVIGAICGFIFALLTSMFLCKKFYYRRSHLIPELLQQNGSVDRHTSVKRLLSDASCKDDVTMSHVTVS